MNRKPHLNQIKIIFLVILGIGLAVCLPWLANTFSLAAQGEFDSIASANVPRTQALCTVETKAGTLQSSNSSVLQDAVDIADSGDTIKVEGVCVGVQTRDGHKQTVLITKSLTLQGSILQKNMPLNPNLDTHPATRT